MDEVEQNIVICQWRADQLFAKRSPSDRQAIARRRKPWFRLRMSRIFFVPRVPECCLSRATRSFVGRRPTHLRPKPETAHEKPLGTSVYYLQRQTQLADIAHEQTFICRQFFVGHVVGFRPMKRTKICIQ